MCKYWRQKTAHPTWQAIGTPKSSSLPGFHHVSVWTQDLFVVPGTQKGSIPVNGHHPAPNPFRHTAWNTPKKSAQPQVATLFWRYIACQMSQHTLKLCQNNAALFWGYITCQKVRHTLKWCKSNATLFWGYITCEKVRHTLKLCKNNAPTCAGLTHTSDSISTLDKCQQASRNFFGGQYISNGSLLQTVQTTVYFLPNWGTSWWCPNTKVVCLIINALAV